ncbi:hypothetical protein [Glutamicibacter nicotianae]
MLEISFLLDKLDFHTVDWAIEIAAELYGDDDAAYCATSREDAPIVVEEGIKQNRNS